MPQSFPADLRIPNSVATVLGADDSLQSINTTLLMDRALVACKANNSLYMLRRESVDAPSGTTVVEPAAGPGRWFIYSPGGDAGSTGALRATWSLRDNCTFTDATVGDPGGVIRGEPGVFAALEVGDTLFVPPLFALGPPFHGGSPAPEFAGIYVVLTAGDDEIEVQRDPQLASAEQVATTALITADQGTGAGVYQVTTPADAIFNVDPQVIPQVAKPPPEGDSDTYTLESQGGLLRWQLGSVNDP